MYFKPFIKQKNNFIATALISLIFIFSQISIKIPVSIAANGAAKIFVIEFLIFAIGIYVVFWKLIIQKSLTQSSNWTKSYFWLMIIFGIFYVGTLIYHYLAHMPLASSFLLARIIIEVCILAISLSFFQVTAQSIFTGLLFGNLVSILSQYYIIFFGVGEIRLGNHNLLGNSITSYVCLIMLLPSVIFFLHRSTDRLYRILMWTAIILGIPTFVFSGSRIAFSIALFILVVTELACLYLTSAPGKNVLQHILTIFAISIISLLAIGIFSSPINKDNLIRSVDVPVSLYNKVAPDFMTINTRRIIYRGRQSEKDRQEDKNKDDEAEKSVALSNYMRVIINSKAKNEISKNTQNVLIGIGMSSIYTRNWGYQKPHNLFLLYLLPFGIIGTIISFLILFGALVRVLLTRPLAKRSLVLMLLTYFPAIIISMNQPIFGTLITCLAFIALTYSLTNYHEQNMNGSLKL